jgi:hypothetical protein
MDLRIPHWQGSRIPLTRTSWGFSHSKISTRLHLAYLREEGLLQLSVPARPLGPSSNSLERSSKPLLIPPERPQSIPVTGDGK